MYYGYSVWASGKNTFMLDRSEIVAIAILVGLAAALVIAGLAAWQRTTHTLGQAILYFVNRIIARVLWRAKISGRLPVSDGQGAVIVSNHYSGIDPLLIQLSTDRIVHWLVATEYFHKPVMRQVFETLGAIPVKRGGIDTASTRTAIRLVQQGEVVGLFPEGRINDTGQFLLPGRPGAALIALKARAPVIPIFVEDAPYNGLVLGSFWMPAEAKVKIGQPVDISAYYGRERENGVLQDLTKKFMLEIAKLAGRNDFEPQLAGRRWKPGEEDVAVAETMNDER